MDIWRLRCERCGAQEQATPPQMVERLRCLGMLRRETAPLDLLEALVNEALPRLACLHCEQTGMVVDDRRQQDDDGAGWPEARRCDGCSQLIPLERLELYPGATRCAACQEHAEASPADEDREFCPRCGGLMTVRLRSRGVAAYELRCPDCGKTS